MHMQIMVERNLPFCSWWYACWCAPPCHHTWHWSVRAAPQGSHHSWNSTCHTSAPACHHYVPAPPGSGQGQTNAGMISWYTTVSKIPFGTTNWNVNEWWSEICLEGWFLHSNFHVLFINSWRQTQIAIHMLYACYVGLWLLTFQIPN